ncbi:hypothetical protein AB0D42_08815 [Streptomyces sp. NPDC048304]|uniref:hypothetical protein n=1 Tax=Streptomyces sp. NPDC048304 TaxID=3154820 RepID=UPI0034023F9F
MFGRSSRPEATRSDQLGETLRIQRSIPRAAAVAVLPVALIATTVSSASGTPAGKDTGTQASFGLAATGYRDVTGIGVDSSAGKLLKSQGFSVRTSPAGQTAVVDGSMADEGIVTAANPGFVDISWKSYAKDARYTVVRDDRPLATLPAGATSFRDAHVAQGASYTYRIVPQLEKEHAGARTWGMRVTIPAITKGESALSAMRRGALSRADAAAVASTTTLTWVAFIPQKYVNTPPAGCDYKSGYQFGGDNHSKFDWKDSRYRTALNAVITWRNKSMQGYKDVQASHVYRKSDHKLVATKKATDKYMSVKKLGSGGNYIDIRMVMHATNPFCKGLGTVKGAIDGALQMHMTTSGNWEIRSGNHRLMPNHYIYIYDGGRVTNAYTRKYASEYCLIGAATCPVADLTGYYGKFS